MEQTKSSDKLSMVPDGDNPIILTQKELASINQNKNNLDLNTNTKSHTELETTKSRGRKRVLKGPPYECKFPGCNKSFQRSEHLSRHKLNHNPKTIFNCTHPGCDKTFVRRDLLVRHIKRHENKIQKQKKATKPTEFLSSVVSNSIKNDVKTKNNAVTVKDIVQTNLDNGILNEPLKQSNISSTPQNLNTLNTTNNNTHFQNISNSPSPYMNYPTTNNIGSTPNLFSWLFTDNNITPSINTFAEPTNTSINPNFSNDVSNSFNNNNNNNNNSNSNSNMNALNNNNNMDFINQNSNTAASNMNFLAELNDFNLNHNNQNFFIVHDDYSPISYSSSNGYFSDKTIENQLSSNNSQIFNGNNIENIHERNPYIASEGNGKQDNLQSFQRSQGHQESDIPGYEFNKNLLYTLTDEQMKEFENLIPNLKGNTDFTKLKFEKCLKTYWNFFHPRFPMLHRPTFNSTDSPILLLLSMIVLGSKLYMCVDNITCPDEKKISHPKILSDTISEPLRWLLFSSPFFQPPAEIWIIQSLLMLEFYEKHCSSRKLHERSHLHHGTTIQLLRRSPTLGGASTKVNSDEPSTTDNINENWYKWIEIESMKRATFMCFYMDAIDAICMGHQMFIYSHQIQMPMPVDDSVWESNFNQFNKNYKNAERPKQFLIVLKNIMNGKAQKTSSFGKKILLAGLNAILFQIQQRDLQLFFGLDKFTNTVSKNWRDLLTAAFSIWRNDVGYSCCSSKTAIDNLNFLGNSSQFSTSDTRCKCIAYHLAHIYMSISHYDIFIICGAPWRMNVKPSSNIERNSIKQRVIEWSKTRHCEISVVQCYLSLFEMFLSPQDSNFEYQYDYLPDADLFFRSYMIGYMLMVIWGYLFVKGKISERTGNEKKLNGYEYLKDIRNQFTNKSSGILLHTWYTNISGAEFYGDLMKWVNVLNDIENLGNIIGLLDLVGNKLINADYMVVKEVGKLLLFCRDRSLGITDRDILENMYISG